MIIVKEQKEVGGYDSQGNRYIWAHLECDSAADLPAPDYFKADAAAILAMGSTAHTIAENAGYELNSGGVWMLQEPGTAAYTKAEVDDMLQARDALQAEDRAALDGLIDSGAKNKLINSMTDGQSFGITFTKNADETVTVSGTASGGNAQRRIMTIPADEAQTYNGLILSGCHSGGGASTYKLVFQRDSSPYTIYSTDTGNGAIIQNVPAAVQCRVFIVVNSGTTIDATFKPMICTAADFAISSDFSPYRPTWQEMWEMIQALQ